MDERLGEGEKRYIRGQQVGVEMETGYTIQLISDQIRSDQVIYRLSE